MKTIRENVVNALENPDYDWRTIDGIARETGLSHMEVMSALAEMEEQIVRTSGKDNHYLYTTRRHYNATQSIFSRSLSAVSGSVKR